MPKKSKREVLGFFKDDANNFSYIAGVKKNKPHYSILDGKTFPAVPKADYDAVVKENKELTNEVIRFWLRVGLAEGTVKKLDLKAHSKELRLIRLKDAIENEFVRKADLDRALKKLESDFTPFCFDSAFRFMFPMSKKYVEEKFEDLRRELGLGSEKESLKQNSGASSTPESPSSDGSSVKPEPKKKTKEVKVKFNVDKEFKEFLKRQQSWIDYELKKYEPKKKRSGKK